MQPVESLDLKSPRRDFGFRTRDGFVERFGAALVERVRREAPHVRLRFLPKTDRDSASLRDGLVDLETGVVSANMGPELMTRPLFKERWIGIVREGHPLVGGEVTAAQLSAAQHVHVSRKGVDGGFLDDAFQANGIARQIAVTVGTFSQALALARGSDLVAVVPDVHTRSLRDRMVTFRMPIQVPPFMVSLLWHPRAGADPAHRWLRQCTVEVCKSPEV